MPFTLKTISYVYRTGAFWAAIDYGTRKYRNLQGNARVALLVDVFGDSNRGILIQGRAELIDKGPEFREIYRASHEKFDWARAMPWKGKAPFVRIDPMRKAS